MYVYLCTLILRDMIDVVLRIISVYQTDRKITNWSRVTEFSFIFLHSSCTWCCYPSKYLTLSKIRGPMNIAWKRHPLVRLNVRALTGPSSPVKKNIPYKNASHLSHLVMTFRSITHIWPYQLIPSYMFELDVDGYTTSQVSQWREQKTYRSKQSSYLSNS